MIFMATKQIMFNIEAEDFARLKSVSKKDDRSMSGFIRTACKERIEKIEKKETMEEIHS